MIDTLLNTHMHTHTVAVAANLLQRDSFYMISNTRSMKLISYCRKAHRVRRCEESVSVLEP